jgi:crotonobetainyl-CoA:carnitine CoA-transferase CaiB-like acyl-CoA transferase
MLVPAPHTNLGSVTLAGVVPKLSATPGSVRWAGQEVGEESKAILREELALAPEEIDRLAERGVIYAPRD